MNDARVSRVLAYANDNNVEFFTADGYAEPGYTPADGLVVFANWNGEIPSRIHKALEKLGVETEWSDEWSVCDDCQKAFRISPDCYQWTRYGYKGDDGTVLCGDCILLDPEPLIADLKENPRKCLTLNVDMEELGYVNLCWNEDGCVVPWENGFHSGQNDDPFKIAAYLKGRGVRGFVFQLDESSQFYSTFSVWVTRESLGIREDEEWDTVWAAIQAFQVPPKESQGVDLAANAAAALKDAAAKLGQLQGEGIRFAHCDVQTGQATVKLVSPEDFVNGIR